MRFAFILFVGVFLLAGVAPAADDVPKINFEDYESMGIDWYIYPEDPLRGGVDPNTGLVYQPPNEPNIPQIKFHQIPPSGSLQERIDRLVEGMTVDIPPEYDHFGYELRRYMATVGNAEIYANAERRALEIKNVKTARIIFDYWIADVRKKMSQISKDIEAQNAPSDVRTSFKYNTGVVNAFQMECQIWLDKNKDLLQFLEENKDQYVYKPPHLNFKEMEALNAFASLYDVRAKARAEINKYPTFSMMVY